MSEMLEKAARAAYEAGKYRRTDDMGVLLRFGDLAEFEREDWRESVRAALLAVREPDETMMLAVEKLMPMETIKALPPGWPGLVAVHGAMIDEVLK